MSRKILTFAQIYIILNTMLRRIIQNMPPVVMNVTIICIIIWLAMTLVPALDQSLTRWCALHYFSSPGFNVGQLFSYMFLHAGFTHLFFNMFALVMFGSIIERTMGSQRFLFYYISCGIFAALVQMAAFAITLIPYHEMFDAQAWTQIIDKGWSLVQDGYTYADPTLAKINGLVNGPVVGASGAIYGVILAFGMLYPNQPIYLYFAVPIKAKYIVIGYALLELSLGLGSVSDNVAHFAHLGGMIAGLALILYWKKKGVFNNHWFF